MTFNYYHGFEGVIKGYSCSGTKITYRMLPPDLSAPKNVANHAIYWLKI